MFSKNTWLFYKKHDSSNDNRRSVTRHLFLRSQAAGYARTQRDFLSDRLREDWRDAVFKVISSECPFTSSGSKVF
jgi:hypothetical protein